MMNARTFCKASADLAVHLKHKDEVEDRRAKLQELQNEEYNSTAMPEDLMSLVGWHMSGSDEEPQAWAAALQGDDAELGRLVRRYIEVVRTGQAHSRAAKRLADLIKHQNDYEGE